MAIKVTSSSIRKPYVCSECGFIGRARVYKKGSKLIEWLAWGIFFIPGPIYSAWRHFSRVLRCTRCHSPELVSLDTPRGQELFEKSLRNFTPTGGVR